MHDHGCEYDFVRQLERRTRELMCALELYKDKLMSEMSGVDKVTLAKLNEIMSDFYDAKANIEDMTKEALENLRNEIDSLLSGTNLEVEVKTEADWNENDATSKGYIKNRPFYSQKETYTLCENHQHIPTEENNFSTAFGVSMMPSAGDVATIIFNGNTHTAIAENFDGIITVIFYENESDFLVSQFNTMPDGTMMGAVICNQEGVCSLSVEHEEIHKVDEKYIPVNPYTTHVIDVGNLFPEGTIHIHNGLNRIDDDWVTSSLSAYAFVRAFNAAKYARENNALVFYKHEFAFIVDAALLDCSTDGLYEYVTVTIRPDRPGFEGSYMYSWRMDNNGEVWELHDLQTYKE